MTPARRQIRAELVALSLSSHQIGKSIEEIAGVVRAGSGFRVVLHRECLESTRRISELQTLDHVVVEADVADLSGAVRGVVPLPRRSSHGKSVVMRGHLDLPRGEVHHRLVDAAMSVPQLEGAEAERPAKELVAEADAEIGNASRQNGLQQLDLLVCGSRITWAIGKEHRIWLQCFDVGECGGRGNYVNFETSFGHSYRGHRFDAKIHRDHPKPRFTIWPHDVRLAGAHLVSEMRADHRRLGLDTLQQRRRVCFHTGNAHPHCASLPDVAGQGASVDVAHPDNALRTQLETQISTRAPVGGEPGGVAYHIASDPDPARFAVLVVPAGIADVRSGRDHHLAVIAGIGQGLLIAGHAGRENRLAKGLTHSAKGPPVKAASVFKHQKRRRMRLKAVQD